jgi:hypothetical protein
VATWPWQDASTTFAADPPAAEVAASPAWQPFRTGEAAAWGTTWDAPPPPAAPSAPALVSWEAAGPPPTAWETGYPIDFGPAIVGERLAPDDPLLWQWRVLPAGVVYPSYMAGVKESRIGAQTFVADDMWLMDVTLGGRAAILRYGDNNAQRPQGWELAIEGAAFPRLNFDENWDLEAVDFRFGVPLTYGRDEFQFKFAYYHLSAHLGDELAIRENLLSQRINYARDALVLGVSYRPLPAWRWYAETSWAFYYDEGALPWEFQFGLDLAQPGPTGSAGTPFAAINGHLREDVDFGGNLVVQAGWLWRGETTSTLRLGVHYFNGKTNQFEFYDQFEQQIGAGLWYDF